MFLCWHKLVVQKLFVNFTLTLATPNPAKSSMGHFFQMGKKEVQEGMFPKVHWRIQEGF